nr:putative ribonuclease H-like domain-containing protein [Tanacetum cinerariifolium]
MNLLKSSVTTRQKPALSFMRPFRCLVTILNTFDHLGTKAIIDVGQAGKMSVPSPQYVFLPLLTFDSQGPKNSEDEIANDAGKKSIKVPRKENGVQDPAKEREAASTNNTNRLNTVSSPINTVSSSFTTVDTNEKEHKGMSLKVCLDKTRMLMATGCSLLSAYDDEVEGVEADFNNLELTTIMDVKSAFLYGTIEEKVYVCQHSGFEDSHFPNKVYKVEKALYGLHQASRAWYETLSTYLLENVFRRGIIDKTLFINKDKGDIMLAHVYVDDIIFGSTKKSMHRV